MFRTSLLRSYVLKELRRPIRCNVRAMMSTGFLRRKHFHKLPSSGAKTIFPRVNTIQVRYYASLPEHTKVPLPALSPTMENGGIISWAKKEGDKLNEGDLLCEIESDKATMGFETPEEGYLAKIVIPAGTKGVPVGKLLCIIVQKQEDVAAFKDFKDTEAAAPPPTPAAAAPAPAAPAAAPAARAPAPAGPALAAPPAGGGRVFASPFARRLAELRKIRLAGQGSGLYNSLKSGDLSGRAAAPAEVAPAPVMTPGASYTDIPLSGMRETIARRLTEAKQTIPHYQLSALVNVDKTLKFRQKINKQLEKSGQKISVNDFIIKGIAAACKRVPAANSHWMETFVRQFTNVDVSVAVATPTGLITPIVFNADSRGLLDINKTVKALADKAKEGKLSPQEYQGGTITVSNLGMFDVTMFNAIINPPQTMIVACGGLQEIVVPHEDEFRTSKFITFTISADHRVIDGAVGAQWLKAFKQNLEDPQNMIL